MSSEERKKILQMVADGKINAGEAAALMRALDDSDGGEFTPIGEASGMGGERSEAPELDQVRRRAHRFSSAFLWFGVIFTVLSAWAMFGIQKNAGVNFWFYCMSVPLFLGIFLITMGAGSRTARWVYVNVDRTHQEEWPRNITIAFPLPLGLAISFLKNFGGRMDRLKTANVDEILQAIAVAQDIKDPLIVHVDDSDDGEKVQVLIG